MRSIDKRFPSALVVLLRRLRTVCVLLAIGTTATSSTVLGQNFTPSQIKVLEGVTPSLVEKYSTLLGRVDNWRARLARIREATEQVGDELAMGTSDDSRPESDVLELAGEILRAMEPLPGDWKGEGGPLAAVMSMKATLDQRDGAVAEIGFDPDEYFDLTEAEFRAEVTEIVEAVIASQLLEVMDQRVFKALDEVRDPLSYAKRFLDGKFKEWIANASLKLDDDGTVVCRIVSDNDAMIFGEKANLAIEIEYVPQDLVVHATGLYFEYVPGDVLPRPRVERLKVDTTKSVYNTVLNNVVDGVLQELTAGTGIGVTRLEWPELDKLASDPKKAAIVLDLEFDVGKLFPGAELTGGSASAKNLRLDCNGIEWDDVKIEVRYQFANPVPLGQPFVALWAFGGSVQPQPSEMAVEGTVEIGATVVPPRVVGLFGTLSTKRPFRQFTLDGSVTFLEQFELSAANVVFDLDRGVIKGTFTEGSRNKENPLDQLRYGKGTIEARSERIVMDGSLEILNVPVTKLTTKINLNEGSASLDGKAGFPLFGEDFGDKLHGGIHSGFKSFDVSAEHRVPLVSDVPVIGHVAPVVTVTIDSGIKPPVKVEIHAFHQKQTFHFDNLDELTLRWLREQLGLGGGKDIANVLRWAKDLEDTGRMAAASMERGVRESMDDKFGGAWKTGHPELDKAGEEISEWAKGRTSEILDVRDAVLKGHDNVVNSLVKVFEDPVGAVGGLGKQGEKVLKKWAGTEKENRRTKPKPPPVEKPEVLARRSERLEALSRQLENLQIERSSPSVSVQSADRDYRRDAYVYLGFGIAGNAVNVRTGKAAVLCPLITSGLLHEFDSNSSQRVKSAASGDIVPTEIYINDIRDESGKGTARINVPEFRNESGFPARDLARDAVQNLVEWYFPDLQIDGYQRFYEKRVAVQNSTPERLVVWVHVWNRRRSPSGFGFEWKWRPGLPGESEALRFELQPGEQQLLMSEGTSIAASRLRITAESESGDRWDEFRHQDRWTVEPNPQFANERIYHGDAMETFIHTIAPHPGPRVFSERALALKNTTNEAVAGELDYLTNREGIWQWRHLEFDVPAKSTLVPRDDLDMRVRAAQIRFSAATDNRRYDAHRSQPLWIVDENPSGRLYSSDKIGEFELAFEPAAGTDPQRVANVRVQEVDVKVGSDVIAKVSLGDAFQIVEIRGDWVAIRVPSGGQMLSGWLPKSAVNVVAPKPRPAPDAQEQRLTVTTQSAPVMVGAEEIGRVRRGQSFVVLESRGAWLKIEITDRGDTKRGWISSQYIRLERP